MLYEQNAKKSVENYGLSIFCVDETGFVEYNTSIRVNNSVVSYRHGALMVIN